MEEKKNDFLGYVEQHIVGFNLISPISLYLWPKSDISDLLLNLG